MINISKMIQHIALDKGIKHKEIANKIGISPNAMSRIINSEPKKIDTLIEIAGALDCDVEIVFRDRSTGKIYEDIKKGRT